MKHLFTWIFMLGIVLVGAILIRNVTTFSFFSLIMCGAWGFCVGVIVQAAFYWITGVNLWPNNKKV